MTALRRADRRCALLLVLAGLLLWLPRLGGPLDLRFDAGVYYILGASLAEGRGYRLTNEPGAIEAVQYPPGLPLIVAAHCRALGTTDPDVVAPALRRTWCALHVALLLATFALARRSLDPARACLAALLAGMQLQTVFLSDLLFAELPFAVCGLVTLLWANGPGPGRRAAAGAAALAGALLRTAGVALLAAWVGEALLRRRWRRAAVRAALAAVVVLAWQGHVRAVRSSPEWDRPAYEYQRAPWQFYNVPYADNAALKDPFAPELGPTTSLDLAGRVGSNLVALAPSLGEAVSTDRNAAAWLLEVVERRLRAPVAAAARSVVVVFGVVGLVVAAGVLVAARRRATRAEALYVGLALGLIALTPWPEQFGRYVAPLAPLLTIALLRTLARLERQRPRARGGRAAAIVALAAILGAQWFTLDRMFTLRRRQAETPAGARLFYYDAPWRALDEAAAWLGARAARGDVVATTAPHRVALATGLRAVFPPFEADPARASALLDGVPARWLVIDQIHYLGDVSRRYAEPVVLARPDAWRLVHTVPGTATRVYIRAGGPVQTAAGATEGGSSCPSSW